MNILNFKITKNKTNLDNLVNVHVDQHLKSLLSLLLCFFPENHMTVLLSKMLHTKQNKRNWGCQFKRHLEKRTENTLYSFDTCKDKFYFLLEVLYFYKAECINWNNGICLRKSVIFAILQKKNIIIMSVHFCQLLCEIYRGNTLVC